MVTKVKTDKVGAARVTEADLRKLPRCAVVAFSARCARRVQPLYTLHWKDAPRQHIKAINRAITLSEATLRNGEASLDNAAAAAALAAATAAINTKAAQIAAALAAATAYALATAAADATLIAVAAEAAAFALAANTDAGSAVHALAAQRSDYELLTALSKTHKWNDKSPVDVALLGPLWPKGNEPAWAMIEPKQSNTVSKKVKITMPDVVSHDEALRLVNTYLGYISELS